ncbi:MAG: hypothetical protein AAF363_06535 [Bacteroidota bacterium]
MPHLYSVRTSHSNTLPLPEDLRDRDRGDTIPENIAPLGYLYAMAGLEDITVLPE